MNWKITISLMLLVFTIGLLSGMSLSEPALTGQIVEEVQPADAPQVDIESPKDEEPDGLERASPADRIRESQIFVYEDEVIIKLDNAVWSTFTDTNSMDPTIDLGSNAIQIVPTSPSEIQVGDIISFESSIGPVIHRVIEIGYDKDGWYAITQGDNHNGPDPHKVRWEDVKRVVVAIIY